MPDNNASNRALPDNAETRPQPSPRVNGDHRLAATQELNATLQAQEWNVVLTALDELPGKFSRPVINKLMQQLDAAARSAE